MSVFPVVPTDYKTLKNACRKGLTMESRQYWWPLLTQVKKNCPITEYPDIDGTSEKLTSLVCEYFAGGPNNVSFEWKTDVLMKSLKKRKGVENPELFNRLVRIIAECIPQIEICFLIGCDILANANRYLQATAIAHGCRLYTFVEVLRRYLPKTAIILDEIGALQPHYLNLMFVDFFRTLLPRQSVLSLLDAYLLEGWRILLRYGLSLIKGYKAQIKARRFGTGDDFWQAVQASARSMSMSIDTAKVESILQAIKINSFDVERPMIERLYRPMNISSASIEKFMTEAKKYVQNNSKWVDTNVYECASPRLLSARGNNMNNQVISSLNDSNNRSNTNNNSNNNSNNYTNDTHNEKSANNTYGNTGSNRSGSTMKDDNSMNSGFNSTSTTIRSASPAGSEIYGLVSASDNEDERRLFESFCASSDILLIDDITRLIPMLPSAVLLEGLDLAFSTTRSGWALGSLYSEVKDLRPCVILIQTLPKPRVKSRLSETLYPPPSPTYTSNSRASEGSLNNSGITDLKKIEYSDVTDMSSGGGSGGNGDGNHSVSNTTVTNNNTTADDDDDDDDEDTNFGEDNERGVILGVYLPCAVSPPSTNIRGDGDVFIFRLTDSINPTTTSSSGGNVASSNNNSTTIKGVKYPSVLSQQQNVPKKSSLVNPLGSSSSNTTNSININNLNSAELAVLSQYAVCASSYMSFGGSHKYSTNAIRIDEELRWIASGPSDTFYSPPLLAASECDGNALVGLTMVPQRRGSGNFSQFSPNIRSRSRSQSLDTSNNFLNAAAVVSASVASSSSTGMNSPTTTMTNNSAASTAAGSPTNTQYSDIDRRASIKNIEVWCGKNSYTNMIQNKQKNKPQDSILQRY